jgi:hypothetical protein
VGVMPPCPAVGSQISTSNMMTCEENETVFFPELVVTDTATVLC